MKKIIFLSTIVLALATSFYSCGDEFLDTKPTASASDVLLADEAGVDALLIGAYHPLVGGLQAGGWFGSWIWSASVSNWVWGSVQSDDGTKGSDITDQSTIVPVENFTIDPTNGYASDKWNGNYEAVSRTNDVLRILAAAGSKVPEAKAIQVQAEARFLRAFYHFELKRVFNNIPYILENDVPETVPNTGVDTWALMEADLQYAIDNLPETQGDVGRPTTYAAMAVMARVHLFQHDYAAAKLLLDDIIDVADNGGKYELMPNFDDNYLIAKRNNKESIWEIQYAVNDGASDSPNANYGDALNYPQNVDGMGTCCGFHQPTQNLVNAYKTDANGLPLLDTYNDTDLKNDMGLGSNKPYAVDLVQTVDPRLDFTVGRRGIPYLDWGIMRGKDWIRDQGNAGPYVYRKNMFLKSEKGTLSTTSGWATGVNANNYRAYRYAHILLWRAEVAVEDNELDYAMELVNRVRARAANKVVMGRLDFAALDTLNLTQEAIEPFVDYTQPAANYLVNEYTDFPDQEYARKAVRMELRLEFAMEGHRFFDLVRWGIVNEVINDYMERDRDFRGLFGGTTPKVFTPNKNEYAPIPQGQIDIQGSEILQQNPGYN
ncbi:MAG: RagB/SusD family nutrient uptake outer membrane protein [Bacteroidales bacterium]|nr:RagB/SusD family nutrient uptake outer membrane protein [Bacteroidales bacterium]